MIKIKQLSVIVTLSILLLACKGLDPKFFIQNYESQPVSVQYKYYEQGQFSDSIYFDYHPKLFVLVADTLLVKKIFKRFPTGNTRSHFDTLVCIQKDSLSYAFNIPARSTVALLPVYAYGDNIELLIFNGLDTIRFMYDYPSVENEALSEGKFANKKLGLLGTGYFLVHLKLKEIENALKQ